ncbi:MULTISPECIES: hypothetical protein [unclassified Rhodococcus (in: high G+C Gram-positive bacteria)]|uniref:hypothetical protein n=1 Tax=unclassified Rhodococcus (in: high G+C Gram-positive bacteria) TaxID=192944 RepID=UPI00163B15DF|nr:MULTISPECIES: hypothetical protein [unclassified Rhodococcus (in: high G+C Gram-positive bacteria)]MBC2644344.1 hypothetical protein [Rhodococcus sp. 3A]MBC2897963.1 hypothetical protein [Rhodococcus sp. 4CII]
MSRSHGAGAHATTRAVKVGIGAAETAESTAVACTLPERVRGNGFGVLGLVQSFGDMGSTVVAGILWSTLSPLVAFGYAAAWMLASVLLSPLLRPTSPPSDPNDSPRSVKGETA